MKDSSKRVASPPAPPDIVGEFGLFVGKGYLLFGGLGVELAFVTGSEVVIRGSALYGVGGCLIFGLEIYFSWRGADGLAMCRI